MLRIVSSTPLISWFLPFLLPDSFSTYPLTQILLTLSNPDIFFTPILITPRFPLFYFHMTVYF